MLVVWEIEDDLWQVPRLVLHQPDEIIDVDAEDDAGWCADYPYSGDGVGVGDVVGVNRFISGTSTSTVIEP